MAGFETAPSDLKPLLSQRINELGGRSLAQIVRDAFAFRHIMPAAG